MNYMRKQVIAAVFAAVFLCGLLGCGEDVDGPDTSSLLQDVVSNTEDSIPETYQQTIGTGLVIDAPVVAPETLPSTVSSYYARSLELTNLEPVLDTFFPDGGYDKQVEEAMSGIADKPQQCVTFTSPTDSQLTVRFIGSPSEVSDALIDLSGASDIYATTDLGYQYFLLTNRDTTSEFLNRDLPFATQAEAEQACRDFLAEINLPIDPEVSRCTAWTAEDAQARKEEIDASTVSDEKTIQIEDFQQGDDCYIFDFYNSIDNMYVADLLSVATGIDDAQQCPGAPIEVMYGAEGVQSLRTTILYQKDGEAQQTGTPVSFETALQGLVDYFNSTISTDTITVFKIEFAYAPRWGDKSSDRMLMRPAWIFAYTSTSSDSQGDRQVLIDALTGKVMT